MDMYLEGLLDYTVDSRGDVGSTVREACLRGLATVLPRVASHDMVKDPCNRLLSTSV